MQAQRSLRLYKREKLCSEIAIASLFASGSKSVNRALCYPLRAVWIENTGRHHKCPKFLIMVPKKRMRHAVDRVLLRRRTREAFRLNHHAHLDADFPVDIAFVYVANTLLPYTDIERAMRRLLAKIAASRQKPEPLATPSNSHEL